MKQIILCVIMLSSVLLLSGCDLDSIIEKDKNKPLVLDSKYLPPALPVTLEARYLPPTVIAK